MGAPKLERHRPSGALHDHGRPGQRQQHTCKNARSRVINTSSAERKQLLETGTRAVSEEEAAPRFGP